eukprot:TRINITY_DN69019_c0_g1_i1.p1 TRINITY_DN69019_c0_g1~~TRINITY_DN69019_c0_g1_i1.p1  ORF type:complete len:546 (-),score=104.48 TRINITY_DN69019_c0_g1_i1:300-1937(-)
MSLRQSHGGSPALLYLPHGAAGWRQSSQRQKSAPPPPPHHPKAVRRRGNADLSALWVAAAFPAAFTRIRSRRLQQLRKICRGAACRSASCHAPVQATPSAGSARLAAWTTVVRLEHLEHKGRPVTVAHVEDPQFEGGTLEMIVQADDSAAGEAAIVLLPGARPDPHLLTGHQFERAVANNDWEVPRIFVGKASSYGILLHPPEGLAPQQANLDEVLKVGSSNEVERRIVLRVGFVGTGFTGSELADCHSVCDVLRDALVKIGVVRPDRLKSFHRSKRWQTVSRTDSGVHARSFHLALPMLLLPAGEWTPLTDCAWLTSRLNAELTEGEEGRLRVLQALPLPHEADLQRAADAREYRYYLPLSELGVDAAPAKAALVCLLRACEGSHSFVNFTDIGNAGPLKKFCRDRQYLGFVKRLYGWRRERKRSGFPAGTNVLENPLRPPRLLNFLATRSLQHVDAFECPDTGMMCIKLLGDGFLYNMIRLLVGAAVAVVRGELPQEVFQRALVAEEMVDLSEFKAKAHGLVLFEQHFNDEEARWMTCPGYCT